MDANHQLILNFIEKIEIYKCSICELEGSEQEIIEHLEKLKNLGKFPFIQHRHLPTGSLIKVKNNNKESYSLTNITGYFYTNYHELCYYINPKIITKNYCDHEHGEFGEYVYGNEVLNCKKIKESKLILEQEEL